MSKHHDRQGRKIGPGIPFTPWDQIKIGVDPDSKKPEKMQKSVASIFGASAKKREPEDDDAGGSRLGKTKKAHPAETPAPAPPAPAAPAAPAAPDPPAPAATAAPFPPGPLLSPAPAPVV